MRRPSRVADVLTSPTQWTKGAFARSLQPKPPIDVFDPKAEQFSLGGAINKVYGRSQIKTLPSLIKNQVREYLQEHYEHYRTIEEWNDHPDRTFEDIQQVIKALDL